MVLFPENNEKFRDLTEIVKFTQLKDKRNLKIRRIFFSTREAQALPEESSKT